MAERRSERFPLAWLTGGILLALAVAVAILRFDRLDELPPRLYFDEAAHGVDAVRVLKGEHKIFFPENNGREGLIVYAVALATSLLGRTVLAIRLPTALASAGTVFVVFWLGRLLFGRNGGGRATPWRGLFIGAVGAGLMAVSLGQTILGRTAFRANFLPLLLSLCFALLWWGWTKPASSPPGSASVSPAKRRLRHGGTWWRIALAGASAGLLLYTYIAARITPLLFFSFGLSFFPLLLSATGRGAPSGPLRRNLQLAGIFVGVAGLVAAPMLIYFSLHPEQFFSRSSQLWVFQPSRSQGQPLGAFLGNVWDHLLAFGFRGDPTLQFNLPGYPLLNAGEALFFWLGAGVALWRWKLSAYRLLLLWLTVMLLPAMLARDAAPHTLRMIGAGPAIYLLAAVGLWEAFRFLKTRLFPILGRQASFLQPRNEARFALCVGLVVSGLILVQGALTFRNYFQKWGAAAVEIERIDWTQWRELTREAIAQPSGTGDAVWLIPSYSWHLSFEYLDQSIAPAHVVYMGAPNLRQEIKSNLARLENVSAARVVDWNDDSYIEWTHYQTERLLFLLAKYGRYLGSDEYVSFTIHNFAQIALDRPWTFYESLAPLEVEYDRGIYLHGIAVGQGGEQLPSNRRLNLERASPLWVTLQWQIAPGLDIDYSISLRLYNSEGGMAYQRDDVLWRSTDHAPTSSWSPDDKVDTLHLLEFPPNLPSDDYELRLVVYDFETLQPTVEIGVWEAETVLVNLRFDGSE